ncbi:MAG: energy transducer TonB [Gemmatimonadetes bacterium]|nr:energy transducer TonB [Gemmatimonadota bacterium]
MRSLAVLLALAAAAPCAAQQAPRDSARIYELHEVEVLPQPQNAADFAAALRDSYPANLLESGVGGTVQLAFVVRPDGLPADVRVLSTPDSAFDAPSVQAVSLLRFTPAQVQGRAVPVRVEQPITWRAEPAPTAAAAVPQLPESIRVYDVEEADVRPLPRNYSAFEAALRELYPRELREARASAEVVVRFAVDASGRPQYPHVIESTDARFEAVSLDAVRRLRFEPAQRGGERVWVWMEVPLEWGQPGSASAAAGDSVNGYELNEVDVLPRPLNLRRFEQALWREYPAALVSASATGTVQVRFRVQPDGTTSDHVVTHSTHHGFDEATIRAMRVLRFSPARVNGRPVPVWADLPIQWSMDRGSRAYPELDPRYERERPMLRASPDPCLRERC